MATAEEIRRLGGTLSRETYSALGVVAIDVSGGNQTVDLGARGIYIGGDGDINVTLLDGTTFLFRGLAAGSVLPVAAKTILQSNTTVTNSAVLF